MFPYINILGKTIPMYSVMILLGVAASLLYYKLSQKGKDFPTADAELVLVYGTIGTVVGAKLLWLLTVLPDFIADLPYLSSQPEAFLRQYLTGGFVFYGGLFGALFAAWLYCRILKLPFYELARSLMPVIPLFHAFGRLGCFFMGCCYGCESAVFGIAFTHSEVAPNGVPLFPVQLIEAGAEFLLFFILAFMSRKKGSGRSMFCLWMIAYGILRFILEFFRADEYRGFLGILSVSQAISLAAIGLAIGSILHGRRKQSPAP